jgi:hypothetical protein
MPHNIRVLAVGAVEYLRDHGGSLSYGWFCSAQTLVKDSRSTDLKHLPFVDATNNAVQFVGVFVADRDEAWFMATGEGVVVTYALKRIESKE